MSSRDSRRILCFAVALSLALHVAAALWVRWSSTSRGDETAMVLQHVSILKLVRRTPAPPQKTQPPAAPRVRALPSFMPVVLVARSTLHQRRPVVPNKAVLIIPMPTVSPTPERLPTPAPAGARCVGSILPVVVQSAAPVPDISAEMRRSAHVGIAAVTVRVSEQGVATDAVIETSSGDAAFDAVAMAMARGSVYSPALDHCKATAGTYRFTVRFATGVTSG